MKSISILGDSISTFEGYNPEGYDVYYDWILQRNNGIFCVEDTWWMQVINHLKGNLLVNNSFSGSRVTGKYFPAANCTERINALSTDKYIPNVILIYIGFNDFGYGVQTRCKFFWAEKYNFFDSAYNIMLDKIKHKYSSASVICGTLMKTVLKTDKNWFFPSDYRGYDINEYNEIIRKCCFKHSCILCDLEKTGYRYETLDTTHATAQGHKTIANAWIECIDKKIFLNM